MTHHGFTLPERAGSAPSIDGPNPHTQTSQNAPHDLQETLFDRAAQLPGVTVADSLVSVPGARAFILAEDHAKGPAEAFQKGPRPLGLRRDISARSQHHRQALRAVRWILRRCW